MAKPVQLTELRLTTTLTYSGDIEEAPVDEILDKVIAVARVDGNLNRKNTVCRTSSVELAEVSTYILLTSPEDIVQTLEELLPQYPKKTLAFITATHAVRTAMQTKMNMRLYKDGLEIEVPSLDFGLHIDF